jgi:hypothetical protein
MASELSAGNFKSAGTLTKVVEMEKGRNLGERRGLEVKQLDCFF